MITIEKHPIHKTEIFIHNGTYTTKDVWEDEIELTPYPFSCTLRIDHLQQSLSCTVVWPQLKPPNTTALELQIEQKLKNMYVNSK
jgi:hypothetical protein